MTVSALPISSTPKAAIVSRTKENRWNHTFREEVAPMALERCLTFFPPGIPHWPQGLGIPSLVQFFQDRKSTRLNSSHSQISYAVFCLKKKKKKKNISN